MHVLATPCVQVLVPEQHGQPGQQVLHGEFCVSGVEGEGEG